MELEYEPETTHLWAMCDNNCQGRSVTLDIDPGTGKFVVTNMYARPGGMDNFNNEGFAIAPQAECVNNRKPTFYAEDSDANGNTLRGGTISLHAGAAGGRGSRRRPRRRNRRRRRRRRPRRPHRRRWTAPRRRSSSR